MRSGGRTILSHRSAAIAWGLWLPRFDGIEITVPANVRGSEYTTSLQRRGLSCHRRLLRDEDVTIHHGLPVTSLWRTWTDLAGYLDFHDLVAAGDSAWRIEPPSEQVVERLRSLRRVRGLKWARMALPLLTPQSRSRPESRIRAEICLANLPAPLVNEPIYDDDGGWLAEPDLQYREARLALEYNGADHASVERMRKDSVRALSVQREHWEIRVYTAVHAFRRMSEVSMDVRQILRRRAPQLLVNHRRSQTRQSDR